MSGPKIIVALCLLVPLASALLIHYVGSSSSSGSGSDRDATPREGQPVGDGRHHSGWTRQSLREALEGRSPPDARRPPWRERELTVLMSFVEEYGDQRVWSRRYV